MKWTPKEKDEYKKNYSDLGYWRSIEWELISEKNLVWKELIKEERSVCTEKQR